MPKKGSSFFFLCVVGLFVLIFGGFCLFALFFSGSTSCSAVILRLKEESGYAKLPSEFWVTGKTETAQHKPKQSNKPPCV